MSEPSHDAVLQFVREHSRPFIETAEVSEQFPETSRRTVFNRLQDLTDRGDLKKRQIGGNSVVWWIQDQASANALRPDSDSQ